MVGHKTKNLSHLITKIGLIWCPYQCAFDIEKGQKSKLGRNRVKFKQTVSLQTDREAVSGHGMDRSKTGTICYRKGIFFENSFDLSLSLLKID